MIPRKLIELIPNKYYFAISDGQIHYYNNNNVTLITVDNSIFPAINDYFGPPNISDIWKFSIMVHQFLSSDTNKKLVQWSNYLNKKKFTNSVFLIGAYFLLCHQKSPQEIMTYLQKMNFNNSILNYLDVTIDLFELNIVNIYEGINAAIIYHWFNIQTFNYKLFERELLLENGHMTWIIPSKMLVLADPALFVGNLSYFVKYFKQTNVQAIVRLNRPSYDKYIFEEAGIAHYDLQFPDVSAPSLKIVKSFLEIAHSVHGAIAVHCTAGLGRSGTLIACYMMRNYNITATQSIGWLRVCRPGSVMGPQQKFLKSIEKCIAIRREKH